MICWFQCVPYICKSAHTKFHYKPTSFDVVPNLSRKAAVSKPPGRGTTLGFTRKRNFMVWICSIHVLECPHKISRQSDVVWLISHNITTDCGIGHTGRGTTLGFTRKRNFMVWICSIHVLEGSHKISRQSDVVWYGFHVFFKNYDCSKNQCLFLSLNILCIMYI